MAREIPISEGNNPYLDEDLQAAWDAEQAAEKEPEAPKEVHNTWRPMDPDQKRAVKAAFLEYLAKGASVTKAVTLINGQAPGTYHSTEHGKVSRKQLYVWRKFDKEFAKDWDEAFAMGIDLLEDRAQEWAWEGNAALVQFLLRIRNPARYAMNRHEVSGPGGGPVPVTEVVRTIIDPAEDPDRPDDAGSET